MALTADILNHHSTEFSSNWMYLLGQKRSRLASFVDRIDYKGERKSFNRIGDVSSTETTVRHDDTTWSDVSMDLRWIYHVPYSVSQPLDEWDATNLGEVSLPDSALVAQHAAAFNRDCDDNLIAAALGDAMTGKLGTTAVALPGAQQIAAGGTGMTLAKLVDTLDILDDADELDSDEGVERVFCWTVKQRSELLNTTEVKSSDYNTVKALAEGKIDSFMGFTFKIIKRLPEAAGTRSCVAWQKGAMKQLCDKKGTSIALRHDKNDAIQVRTAWRLGAVRVYDEAVVQIDCVE